MISRLVTWMKATVLFASSIFLLANNKVAAKGVTWEKPETQTISCASYFSEATPYGVLYNNVWNGAAAGAFAWSQCLERNHSHDSYGWSWVWPTAKGNNIYAYPQIKLGISPWDPSSSVKSDFPIKGSTVRSLVVEHELEIQGSSEHNVATSLWLTNTREIGDSPNPSIIVAELMIWSYATPNHMNPAGSHTDNFEAGNQTWEVWVEKNWRDASGANDNTWVYITFRAKNQSLKTKFDVMSFTNYAIEQQILPADFYISDIELGTEIMSGSGLAWVKQFNVVVNR